MCVRTGVLGGCVGIQTGWLGLECLALEGGAVKVRGRALPCKTVPNRCCAGGGGVSNLIHPLSAYVATDSASAAQSSYLCLVLPTRSSPEKDLDASTRRAWAWYCS